MMRMVSLFVALLVAVPAAAGVVQVRYDGVVGNAAALPGLFGAATDLTGLGYRADLVYDTSVGNLVEGTDFAFRQGGTFFGADNPFVSGSLTINGVTVALIGGTYSQIGTRSSSGGLNQTYHDSYFNGVVGDFEVGSWLVQYINIYSSQIPLDIDGPLDFTATADDEGRGYFEIVRRDIATGEYLQLGSGDLVPARVRIMPMVSAIPDAPGWALMIVGFGIVGTALRLRAASPPLAKPR